MGERIKARRVDAGFGSIQSFRDAICRRLPPYRWPDPERIRRYEAGKITLERTDFVLVAAMADALECTIADISPELAETGPQIQALVAATRSTWFSTSALVSAS